MKIKKKSVYYFLLILCISSLFGTNYLFSSMYAPDLMVIMLAIFSTYLFIRSGCKIYYTDYKSTIYLNILMWLIGVAVASKYNLPLFVILKESAYTIIPIFLYFAFRPYINKKDDIYSFLSILCISAVICNLLSLFEYSSLINGMDLLNMGSVVRTRYGTPRFIFGDSVFVIGFFSSFAIISDNNIIISKKIIHIINVILSFCNLFFVVKTRTMILFFIATILMLPVLNNKNKTQIRILYFFIVIILLILVVASDFIPSINAKLNNDYGVQARIAAINHYLGYFKKNVFTGVGYISGNSKYSTYSIVSGLRGRFYTSDVGIIGLLFTNGLIGLVWLISWYYNGVKIIIHNKNTLSCFYISLVKMLIIYFAFSSINLIFTDSPRFPMIALGMILIESIKYFNEDNTVTN